MNNTTDFAALLGPHVDALYRAAYRLTANRPDAEDLFQETCLRAYLRRAELAILERPRSWLLKVQYRVFLDGVRRRERAAVRPLANAPDADTLQSADPGPEALTASSAAEAQLLEAWTGLEKEQRALLGLHAEGYSLAEIHTITNLAPAVLKARLYRARVRLGKALAKHRCEATVAWEKLL